MSSLSSDAIAKFALILSAVSLTVSSFQAYNNRKTSHAQVKPIVNVSFEYRTEGSGWELRNKGVGPASFKWFQVLVDGVPVPTWDFVPRALEFPEDAHFRFAVPSRGTYSAGEVVKIFWVEPGEADKKLRKGAQRIAFKYCFCSVQDDCWIGEQGHTEAADNCPEMRVPTLMSTR
jgi:hypothetical protein